MENKKYTLSDLDALNAEYVKQTNILADSENDIRKYLKTTEEFADRLNPSEYAIYEEQQSLFKHFQQAKEDLLNAYKESIKEVEESLEKQKEEESEDDESDEE